MCHAVEWHCMRFRGRMSCTTPHQPLPPPPPLSPTWACQDPGFPCTPALLIHQCPTSRNPIRIASCQPKYTTTFGYMRGAGATTKDTATSGRAASPQNKPTTCPPCAPRRDKSAVLPSADGLLRSPSNPSTVQIYTTLIAAMVLNPPPHSMLPLPGIEAAMISSGSA
ncbi:hypothetical protein GQ53DRAFT_431956 [Thozetella sp. PMI_491]|nr:hypothetical protein GQ53DRAFT_431956 [Thozetella sp. PMI_491]